MTPTTRNWDGKKFIPAQQLKAIKSLIMGEEGAFFREAVGNLTRTVNSMPVTYEQDGKGDDAVAYLHYFSNGWDYYITEADMDGGIDQAFGWVDSGANPEYGYISIRELCSCSGIEVDLHWTPTTIADIKRQQKAGV